jgi:hypothetical protein
MLPRKGIFQEVASYTLYTFFLFVIACVSLSCASKSGSLDTQRNGNTQKPKAQEKTDTCWPTEYQNNNKKTGEYPDLRAVNCGEVLKEGLHSRRVTLKLCIDESGKVLNVLVLKSLCPEADQLFIRALKNWEYEPYLVQGHPAPSICVLTITVN